MIIDIDPQNPMFVTVFEEENQHFVNVQKASLFHFCPDLEMGKYRIPTVALPALKNAMCKIRYSFQYTPALKAYLQKFQKERSILEEAKQRIIDPNIEKDIIENVKLNSNFQLAETQLVTIAFALLGKRILIGNEIGDGKTLTANALAMYLKAKGIAKKIIVVTSASLVENYVQDYIKFFGSDGVVSVGDMAKKDRPDVYKMFATPNNGIHLLALNYDKCYHDYIWLQKLKPDIVIVDEFHKIRNFLTARRSQKFFELVNLWNPKYRIPMTGAPIENKLFDLYPVFKFLNDGEILGTQEFFERNFIEFEDIFYKIKTKAGRTIVRTERKATGFKNHEFLKDIIRPLVIRKKTKLPVDLYETYEAFDMSVPIKAGYAECAANWHSSRQYLNNPERNNIKINPKLDRMIDIVEQSEAKTVVFSFYKDTIRRISRELTEKGIKHHIITGDVKEDAVTIIDRFKEDKEAKVLLCTDRVQDGVNIQFARNVINFEGTLKPSAHRQRVGRVYRRGQQHDVHAWTFYYRNSIEEDLYKMVQAKAEIIRKVFDELDLSLVERKLLELDREFLEKMVAKYGISVKMLEMEV